MQRTGTLRTSSPVKVIITPVDSLETNSSGRRGSGRPRSADVFNQRRGSLQLPRREVTTHLNVPGLTDSVEKLTLNGRSKGNNSSSSNRPRNRSASPFDRDRLPTGSPTFQKVLYEILAETEIDFESTDDESSSKEKQSSLKVPNPRKRQPVHNRRRMSLSPSVHFRRKSMY